MKETMVDDPTKQHRQCCMDWKHGNNVALALAPEIEADAIGVMADVTAD